MKNRYGDEYAFKQLSETTYTIVGDLKYWRYGGQEGQEQMDLDNLGFVDPSGGPFIQLGMQIEGRTIRKISVTKDLDVAPSIVFEVEK
jgi:hypothetical protein